MVVLNSEIERLEEARKKAAEYLNIDLSEPKQERRIEALEKLHKKCWGGADARTFIYKDNVAICDRLMEIYREQQANLDDLRVMSEPFTSLKVRLENIVYKFRTEISLLDSRLEQNQKLINYLTHAEEDLLDDFACRKRLKEIEDKCWENWLKAVDVNQELRNTVIGFENRKALLKISKLYIDYHILANSEVSKCFQALKDEKKGGIQDYYDTLSKYQLPVGKRIDFKIFLQEMIESKLSDSAEVKSIMGEFADTHRKQITGLINEVRDQYERDQKDVFAIMNFYKQKLINKQVLFTNESENMVIYFKRRYMEKIDLLCSRFQMFNSEMNAANKAIRDEKLRLFKGVVSDEFDFQINQLKIDYSKRAIPFLDNFWHLEQNTSQKYALDEIELNQKLKDLKISKNIGMKSLIDAFKADRDKLRSYFDKKLNLIENVDKISIEEFDSCLNVLKDECELLCCELVNMNARFWTKINTEFNCALRRYLIQLRQQYAPYLTSWKSDSKPWMEEYLHTNLNHELLKAMGETLEGFSPESSFYKKISSKLFRLNENIRDIMVKRDNVESQQLLLMNTLGEVDYAPFEQESHEKLLAKEELFLKFQNSYNEFYNSIIVKGGEF